MYETIQFSGVLIYFQKSLLNGIYLGSSTSSSAGGTFLSIILRASLF